MFRFSRGLAAFESSLADPMTLSGGARSPKPFVFRENLRAHSGSEKYI